jgi:hypothetical protein
VESGDRDPALMRSTRSTWPARVGALVFLLLGVGYAVWDAANLDIPATAALSTYIISALQAVPAIAAILLPAVVLVRHPDAWSHTRALFFGTILYAAVQGLLILADPLQPLFETLTPASDDLPFLVPMAALYNGLISVVAALGLGYIGIGLSIARRYPDAGPRWATAWLVPVATVFGALVGVLAVSRIQFGDTPMTPPLAIYLASSVILGVLRIVMWAWLASVAVRGWLAGEDPRSGWGLATAAAAFVLLALALVNLSGLFDIPNDAFGTALGYAIVIAYAGGHVLLLAAFAVGLPEIATDDDGEFDPDDDYDDDDYDGEEDDEEDDEGPDYDLTAG